MAAAAARAAAPISAGVGLRECLSMALHRSAVATWVSATLDLVAPRKALASPGSGHVKCSELLPHVNVVPADGRDRFPTEDLLVAVPPVELGGLEGEGGDEGVRA